MPSCILCLHSMKHLDLPNPLLVFYIYPVMQNNSYWNTEKTVRKTRQIRASKQRNIKTTGWS